MTAFRDSRAAAPPPGQGRRRFLWRLVAVVAIFAAVVAVVLWMWGSADWYGRPEALLPADTTMVATWRDFSGFLRRVESLKAVGALLADKEARATLQVDASGDADGGVKLVSGADRLFLDRYLGRELTVGVVPPSAPGKTSTVLVVARTRMGFEEKMAEMVTRHSPKSPLEHEAYRGHTIYRYRDSDSPVSFACCRFGKTVVASVFSDDPAPVRGMIDRKKGEGRSLMDVEEYAESVDWRAEDGQMAAFLRPERVGDAVLGLPGMEKPDEEVRFWLGYAESCFGGVRWAALRTELNEGFHVHLGWRASETREMQPAGRSDVPEILSRLPRKSPLLFSVESSDVRAFLSDLHRRLRESDVYRRDVKRFEKSWRKALGTPWRDGWLDAMGGGFGMALTGLGGGLMPLPSAHFWWEFASAEAASRSAKAVSSPPIGYGFGRSGGTRWSYDWNRVVVGKPLQDSLGEHPLLAHVWEPEGGSNPVLVLLIDLRSSYREIQGLESAAQLWSAGDREAYEACRKIFTVARHFQALRLTAEPTGDGGRAALYVSVH